MKEKKHVVSLSGGKDSTAMLLMMIEKKMPVDMIIFCDTGKEFQEMYNHIDKVEKYINMPIIRLKSDKSFDYYMFEHVQKGKYQDKTGYSWAGMNIRWCTSRLKTDVIRKYLKSLAKEYEIIHYIGIAVDEPNRIKDKTYPLVEWKITEEALQYCYDKGFDWGGLYEIFKRVSCWCCPLQSLEELRKLRRHFPKLWEELQEMDKKTWHKFKPTYSVAELEQRFTFEEERSSQGYSIKNKEFYTELKKIIAERNDANENKG